VAVLEEDFTVTPSAKMTEDVTVTPADKMEEDVTVTPAAETDNCLVISESVVPVILLNPRETSVRDCSKCETWGIKQKRHLQRGIKSVKKSAKFQRQLKRMIRTEDPDGFKQECSTCKKRKEPSRNTVELSEQSKSSSEIEDSSSTMENWCLEPCKRSGQIPSWKIKRIRSGKSSVNDQASDRNEKLKAIKNPRKDQIGKTESTDDDELSRSSAPSPMDVK
ncbi:hypothetical protein TNCT_554613, partial [Trichonephila clavata]